MGVRIFIIMKQEKLKESIKLFRHLAENSPLEAPVPGFNRHLRYMSPNTRDMVLKAREPEIMAFAEDRKIDPQIVMGIAEAAMRLGRIPDVGMYGLAGDEALAVKDFIADTILNVAEDELNLIAPEAVNENENGSPKGKHLKLASDYKKLSDFHTRRAKEETDKSKFDKDNGRAHSAIRGNAAAEQHKTLAAHCAGLADYHQIKANEMSGNNVTPPEYPAENPKKSPPEPPQDYSKKEKTPHKVSKPRDRASKEDDEVEPDDKEPTIRDEASDPFSMVGRQFGKKAGGALAGAFDQKYRKVGQQVGGQLGSMAGKAAGSFLKSRSESFNDSVNRFRRLRVEGINSTVGGLAGQAGGAALGGALLGPPGAAIGRIAGGFAGRHLGATGLAKAAVLSNPVTAAPYLAYRGAQAIGNMLGGSKSAAAPAPAAPKPAAPQVAAPVGQPPAPPNPPQTEQTVSGGVRGQMNIVGAQAFPKRMNSILPVITRGPVETQYTQWEGKDAIQKEIARGDIDRKGYDKNDASRSGQEMTKKNPKWKERAGSKSELDRDDFGPVENVIRGKFRDAEMLDDLLEQSKNKKAAKKDSSKNPDDPDTQNKPKTANEKIAPLFHHLGHKIDHAATKAEGKSYSEEWANKLKSLCQKSGGSAASDAVIQYSLNNPWIREQGFTDESSNLRRKWETAMSDDARIHAMDASPLVPEPVVLTIGRFIKMSDK